MKMKKCSKCGKEYTATMEYFRSDKPKKDGLSIWCKKCRKKYDDLYREKNKETIRIYKEQYDKQYYLENKDKINKCGRKYYQDNKAVLDKRHKEYCKENSQIIKDYKKEYYEKNKVKIKQYYSQYIAKRQQRNDSEIVTPKKKKCLHCGRIKSSKKFSKCRDNKDGLDRRCKECGKEYLSRYYYENSKYFMDYWKKHRTERNIYKRNRKNTDLNYKILEGLRVRLCNALKSQNATKSARTIELIGCSIENLRGYIESRFSKGMTWDNYGYYGWHIDHIKPCAMFDLTNLEEQKKCFNYKNLQPLWHLDNYRKTSRYKGILYRNYKNKKR